MTIHVLMACHNRRTMTVTAVETVLALADTSDVPITVTVFDDGSTDGTSDALRQDDRVTVLAGDGSYFWARAMATAEQHVLGTGAGPGDHLLWLNDDVVLDEEVLPTLLRVAARHEVAIVVGATCDPGTGDTTYSGLQRSGPHPLRLARVRPTDTPQRVHTMNGNIVLVPLEVARVLAGIDGRFAHALADVDYGFRAGRAGIPVLLAPGHLGSCSRNPPAGSRPLLAEWRKYTSTKGPGHAGSMQRILRRQRPVTWPIFMTITYCLWWARALSAAPHRRGLSRP